VRTRVTADPETAGQADVPLSLPEGTDDNAQRRDRTFHLSASRRNAHADLSQRITAGTRTLSHGSSYAM
jgi:hypothetical protein